MTLHPPIGERQLSLAEQLDIRVDEQAETVTLAGTTYSAHMFTSQGFGGLLGRWLRIDQRDERGVLTVTGVSKPFNDHFDQIVADDKVKAPTA